MKIIGVVRKNGSDKEALIKRHANTAGEKIKECFGFISVTWGAVSEIAKGTFTRMSRGSVLHLWHAAKFEA
jgi:hypothetical protein